MRYLITLWLPIFLFGCYGIEPEKTGQEGKLIPEFELLLADSTNFSTKEIPGDKPVLLVYFSPNCPYSRAQIQELIDDIDKLKNIRLYIFTSLNYESMKKFYDEYNLNKYPTLTVGVDKTNFFSNYLEVKGVPFTAIYNNNKKLKKAFLGKIYSSQIMEVANAK